MKRLSLLLCCAAACAFVGCGDDSVAESEGQERANALFTQAVAAADNGNAQEAERLYRELLGQDGDNASAHLNLAILEDDVLKNYLEAVHHYQVYLALQPNAEKRGMVEERLVAARESLAAQLGGGAEKARADEVERKRLGAEIATLKAQIGEQEALLAEKDKTIKSLEAQVATWKRTAAEMEAAETAATRKAEQEAAKAAAEKLAKEAEATSQNDEDAMLAEIAAARAEAERMINEEDGGVSASNAATRKAVEGQADTPRLGASPVPGQDYVVRPGDTLSSIAREAYGSGAKWEIILEANRATLPPNGRDIKPGQVLIIPEQ